MVSEISLYEIWNQVQDNIELGLLSPETLLCLDT